MAYALLTYNFDLEFGGLQGILTDLFVVTRHRGSGLVRAAWRGRAPLSTSAHRLLRTAGGIVERGGAAVLRSCGVPASGAAGDGQVTRRLTEAACRPEDAARWATPADTARPQRLGVDLARTWAAPPRTAVRRRVPRPALVPLERSTTTPRSSTSRTTGPPDVVVARDFPIVLGHGHRDSIRAGRGCARSSGHPTARPRGSPRPAARTAVSPRAREPPERRPLNPAARG